MRKLRAIILDDEISAITNLKILVENFCPNIDVILTETNPLKVVPILQEDDHIDVLFIDINMGGITGFDIVRLIDVSYLKVVFVTAHSDKAIDAIEFRPFGYLLKPIDIDKLKDVYSSLMKSSFIETNKVRIPTSDGYIWLVKDEFLYVQADRSYSKVFLRSGVCHILSKSMIWFIDLMNSSSIVRCHRSYAININKVESLSKKDGGIITLVGGSKVPLGKNKKTEILKMLA